MSRIKRFFFPDRFRLDLYRQIVIDGEEWTIPGFHVTNGNQLSVDFIKLDEVMRKGV